MLLDQVGFYLFTVFIMPVKFLDGGATRVAALREATKKAFHDIGQALRPSDSVMTGRQITDILDLGAYVTESAVLMSVATVIYSFLDSFAT